MDDTNIAYFITKLSDKKEPIFIHGRRVAELACSIAKVMGYTDDEIEIIRQAARAHDVGKLRWPRYILNKPGSLNKDELAIIRKHPELGYAILKQITMSETNIGKIILQHHERLDGSGYPFGLSGDSIIPMVRIVSVADVIDAMISPQVYRPALSMEEALQEIKNNSGLLYDHEVVKAAVSILLSK